MFIEALFTIAKSYCGNWKRHTRLQTNEWIQENVVCTCNEKLFSLRKDGIPIICCSEDEPYGLYVK